MRLLSTSPKINKMTDFTDLKKSYPKRAIGNAYSWPEAHVQVQRRLKEGHTWETMLEGTKAYCEAARACGDYGTCFVKQASTFYGPKLHFLDEYETETQAIEYKRRTPEVVSEEQRKRDADKAIAQMDELARRRG